ncbi:TetR/AcrR family transcriptional regulator [Mycobacterium kyorinense]|uniref:TetR/AcrR family transcriptional regulator n=1 Tax=Mycobacterium kyorinense TaxID=487514 RepID=UPI0018D3541D|nr:TetR/AcrR family transcriptional regulator [Mycobacterium kyorinense]
MRTHTGRRRNDAARDAILTAAAELLESQGSAKITMASIAQRAGAGKQTLYRWWPTKGALLLEAMVALAESEVIAAETSDLRSDLTSFVRATFAAATKHRSLLLGVLREALGDPDTAAELDEFAASRRAALREIIEAAVERGEIVQRGAIDLVVDQVFGLLWYRLIFGNAPLTRAAAGRVVESMLVQLMPAGSNGRAPSGA